ncbi:hypothetical protein [Brumimicrobium aurantiacum]|uniref:Uncharacterized protein n=1 Tax=Brumimicrobium aurantiacum TaxID=1737063 RepID=A0A3E1EZN6_9FLAO|nr:hypothetical protein [Brumimicrobium aurantiacum]RFC55015.1 hypothetical protein DXU93_04120 [Brumimicrobium aurantiacum]
MAREKFDKIQKHWKQFNISANAIANELMRSKNIVAEMTEFYSHQYYSGEKLNVSSKGIDIISNSKSYQVKGRKVGEKIKSTSLGIIRSWDFDFLTVLMYNNEGEIIKAIEIPSNAAKEISKQNKHQNGWVISTNSKLFNHVLTKDITLDLKSKLGI